MSLNTILESLRLVFKPLNSSYCNDSYLQWLNDKEVTRYLEIFEPYSKEQLKDYLEMVDKNERLLFWAIHSKETDLHIGNIKIDPINYYHRYGEYGIMMGDKGQWGKGYAAEASMAIIDYCFKEMNLRKINLGVVEDNEGAVKLYQKLGFKTEGVYRKHGLYDGRYCNLLRMAIFNPFLID